MAVGLLFKIGAVPFASWTPDVYTGAPTPVSGWMAVATKLVALVVFLLMTFSASGELLAQVANTGNVHLKVGELRLQGDDGLPLALVNQKLAESVSDPGLLELRAEIAGQSSNFKQQVADYTGGQFNPEPSNVFTTTGKSISTTLTLWPGFLGLAVLLSLAELVLRKWKGLFGSRIIS
mgnify:CR=1 FL=1